MRKLHLFLLRTIATTFIQKVKFTLPRQEYSGCLNYKREFQVFPFKD